MFLSLITDFVAGMKSRQLCYLTNLGSFFLFISKYTVIDKLYEKMQKALLISE